MVNVFRRPTWKFAGRPSDIAERLPQRLVNPQLAENPLEVSVAAKLNHYLSVLSARPSNANTDFGIEFVLKPIRKFRCQLAPPARDDLASRFQGRGTALSQSDGLLKAANR